MSGNTLAGIAQLCGVTLDDLILANIDRLAPLGALEAVPIGFTLYIPVERQTSEELDCTPRPAREQVIEYRPRPGEGLFCLSQMFGVSTAALIQGNIRQLTGSSVYGEVSLLIPPIDGALYTVTADDIESGVTLADLASWYGVEPEAITDWNGNPVEDPLSKGQQLFIPEATLSFGIFQSQPPETEESG